MARSGWRPPAPARAYRLLICGYGTIVAAGFPVIDQTRPTPQIARWLTETSRGSTEPLALYRLSAGRRACGSIPAGPVTTIETADDLGTFLHQHPGASVVLTERDVARLRDGLFLEIVYTCNAVIGTTGRGFAASAGAASSWRHPCGDMAAAGAGRGGRFRSVARA